MWMNVYEANVTANIEHRGAESYNTTNMESLAPANSLADSLGYNLPFKNVSMPSGAYSPERFGFELQIWVADIDETIASDEDEAVKHIP
jgi:hypothetical protein